MSPTGGGNATAEPTHAALGETVKLTATPTDGYHFKGWTTEPVVDITDNSFIMPDEPVTVTPDFERHNFTGEYKTDSDNHWQLCACGVEGDKYPHTYSKGVCTACGYIGEYDIYVNTGDGEPIQIHVKTTDTVRSLKEKIEQSKGIPLALQVLKTAMPEEELENDQYLGDDGIKSATTLNMTLEYEPKGSGEADDPYIIPNAEEFEAFQYYINYMSADGGQGKYFKLTADIDLKNEPWTPIGYSADKAFKGNFDGGGHTISGLYIDKSSEDYQGLFGIIEEGSTLKDISVSGSVTGGDHVGGIVGESNGATIENCHSSVLIDGSSSVGGIAGSSYQCTIKNCSNSGIVSGRHGTGGIVGDSSSGSIEKCYNSAEINGSFNVGGIAGSSMDNVTNCYNTGNIEGIMYVGGIVGTSFGLLDADIENCYNTGSISSTSGSDVIGGIIGLYSSPNVTVSNSYYLDTCGADGLGTAKTSGEFSSGEVTYLLQKGQEAQIWGQNVGSGNPELTDEASKTVYQITGEIEGQKSVVWYSNNKATVVTAPKKAGYTFKGWSTVKGGSVDFTAGVPVSGDMTVYAIYERNESETGGDPSGSGSGNTPTTGSDNPSDSEYDNTMQTGDESHIGLWLTLMIISLIGVVMILVSFTVKRRLAVDKNGHRNR